MALIQELIRTTNHWGFVEYFGVRMFLGGNDDGVALRIHAGEGYEPESLKVWADLCKKHEFAIDVGAHTGIYSLVGLKAGAAVVSVEPYWMNFARLTLNLRANGFSTKDCNLMCASDVDGEVPFGVRSSPDYLSSGGSVGLVGSAYYDNVECFRLDRYAHLGRPVIKIDVENHAKEVLKGMKRILESKPPLIIECTETGLTEILKPLGYKFFMIDEREGLSPVDELIPEFFDNRPVMHRLNRLCQ